MNQISFCRKGCISSFVSHDKSSVFSPVMLQSILKSFKMYFSYFKNRIKMSLSQKVNLILTTNRVNKNLHRNNNSIQKSVLKGLMLCGLLGCHCHFKDQKMKTRDVFIKYEYNKELRLFSVTIPRKISTSKWIQHPKPKEKKETKTNVNFRIQVQTMSYTSKE